MDYLNKTRTSKVGAIHKAQKAQNIFFGKLEIFDFFSFKKSRKWDPRVFLTFNVLQSIKNRRGTLCRQKNFRKKIAQCRKKIERGTL